jgi:hypothetical protein
LNDWEIGELRNCVIGKTDPIKLEALRVSDEFYNIAQLQNGSVYFTQLDVLSQQDARQTH